MKTTIEAMKQALKVCIEMGRFGDVAAVEKADATNAVLRESIKREEAQTVEPDHIADPRKMVLGERENITSSLKHSVAILNEYGLTCTSELVNKAADMLAADALEIKRLEQTRVDEAETTNIAAQASRDLLTKALNVAQQAVVPQGYALISLDMLKTWGVYEDVVEQCQYYAVPQPPQADAPQGESK